MEKENLDILPESMHIKSIIDGFDVEINNKDKDRIDNLVNDYEQIIMKRIEDEYEKKATSSDKLADKIASFGGSWKFIVIMGVSLFLWILWNVLAFTKILHFDEQPFILLNLVLSFTAAFQAPIIMMSQNRQSARDKHESIIDFAINYKSEKEISDMQGHLHRIEAELMAVKNLLKNIEK